MGGISDAEAIAHSYMLLMRSGVLDVEAVRELRNHWRLLDPKLTLLPDVTTLINEEYAKLRTEFVDSLNRWNWSSILFCFVPLGFDSLGEVFCWPFKVEERDVRHALDILEVPPADEEPVFKRKFGDAQTWK